MSDLEYQTHKAFRTTMLQAGALMLLAELGIMLVLGNQGVALWGWRLALVDALILTAIAGPVTYFFIVLPQDRKLRASIEELNAAKSRAEELVRHDDLTGVLSRRAVFEELALEWKRTGRYGNQLSCLMIDVDHFKALNDTYGHLKGDEALRKLGETLREACRGVEQIGRYGGEEFLVVIPETSMIGAVTLAERIRKAVEESDVGATVSIGVAERRVEHGSGVDMVQAADQALLDAKFAGRNRVMRAAIGRDGGAVGSQSTPSMQYNLG